MSIFKASISENYTAGKTWIKFNKGNGQSDRINDIAIDYFTPGKYYVSTYGSGFYVAKEAK